MAENGIRNRQLAKLIRIREAKRDVAELGVKAAIRAEQRINKLWDDAHRYRLETLENANDYFLKRLARSGQVSHFGDRVQSVMLGSANAKRAVARATLVEQRLGKRLGDARETRSGAAKVLISETRKIDGIKEMIAHAEMVKGIETDICEEDDLQELQHWKKPDAR
jgi:hypothetical protein